MAVQVGHGGTKFGAGDALAVFEAVPAPLTGYGFNAQPVKKVLPERQIFQQVQGGRKADGKFFFIFSGGL